MKNTILALLISMSFPMFAHAGMEELCQKIATEHVTSQFLKSFRSPKVFVDETVKTSTSNYPSYEFQFKLSGLSPNIWVHQSWKVEMKSLRGGCGVVNAELLAQWFDQ